MSQGRNFRIGPIEFAPGVSGVNAWTFLYLNFMIMPVVSFLSISQPYVLNELVGVAAEEQGRLTGYLSTMQELIALLLINVVGAMSERVGRRPIYALGVFLAGVGFALYSTADSVEDLYAFRFVYAVGVSLAGVMIGITAADYPAESSRGKLSGATGLLNGLGVALAAGFLYSQLPGMFKAQGATSAEAGSYMLLVMAGLSIITAFIMQLGLKGGTPTGRVQKVSLAQAFQVGLGQGLANARLMVCYTGSFVARADLTLIAVFVSLWLSQAARNQGMDGAEAAKQTGIMILVIQSSSLLWAPVAGILIDRFHRLLCVCGALALAGSGYFMLGLQENPFTPLGYSFAVLVGIGQMSVILTVTALIGQETPINVRGSVISFAGLCGAVGILVTSFLGGFLFDHWMISGPVVFTGLANLAVLGLAIRVWLRDGRPVRFDPSEARSGQALDFGH